MTTYTVVNTGSTELTNINSGNYDIPPRSICEGITLTTAELAAAVALADVVVTKDTLTRTQARKLARGMKYLTKRVAATG